MTDFVIDHADPQRKDLVNFRGDKHTDHAKGVELCWLDSLSLGLKVFVKVFNTIKVGFRLKLV